MSDFPLPIELLYTTLDKLAAPLYDFESGRDVVTETRRHLARCTLVSRTWRDIAQPLLFHFPKNALYYEHDIDRGEIFWGIIPLVQY